MKATIFSFLALLSAPFVGAQYHIVQDPGGFVNVRETGGTDGKIICQLNNGTVVFQGLTEDPADTKWIFVQFYLSKNQAQKINAKAEEWMPEVMNGYTLFSGYIYKDRLFNLEERPALKRKQSETELLLFNDSVRIKFSAAGFQKQKHKITTEENIVTKIDGHYFMGTDGSMPRHEIKTFTVEVHDKKIEIPRKSFLDLYEPNFWGMNGYFDTKGNLYIVMYNSDAAGSYSALFVIKDGKYITRYVFAGDC